VIYPVDSIIHLSNTSACIVPKKGLPGILETREQRENIMGNKGTRTPLLGTFPNETILSDLSEVSILVG